MTNMAKLGYYIISYIPKISKILYPKIYPYQGYYIRYRYEKIYIFPTTAYQCINITIFQWIIDPWEPERAGKAAERPFLRVFGPLQQGF